MIPEKYFQTIEREAKDRKDSYLPRIQQKLAEDVFKLDNGHDSGR